LLAPGGYASRGGGGAAPSSAPYISARNDGILPAFGHASHFSGAASFRAWRAALRLSNSRRFRVCQVFGHVLPFHAGPRKQVLCLPLHFDRICQGFCFCVPPASRDLPAEKPPRLKAQRLAALIAAACELHRDREASHRRLPRRRCRSEDAASSGICSVSPRAPIVAWALQTAWRPDNA